MRRGRPQSARGLFLRQTRSYPRGARGAEAGGDRLGVLILGLGGRRSLGFGFDFGFALKISGVVLGGPATKPDETDRGFPGTCVRGAVEIRESPTVLNR